MILILLSQRMTSLKIIWMKKMNKAKYILFIWRKKDIDPIDTSFKEPPLTPQPQPDEPPNHYFKQFVSDDMLGVHGISIKLIYI